MTLLRLLKSLDENVFPEEDYNGILKTLNAFKVTADVPSGGDCPIEASESTSELSSQQSIQEWTEKLTDLGWTHTEIRGESSRPDSYSLIQVMREGTVITSADQTAITLRHPSGSTIKFRHAIRNN